MPTATTYRANLDSQLACMELKYVCTCFLLWIHVDGPTCGQAFKATKFLNDWSFSNETQQPSYDHYQQY